MLLTWPRVIIGGFALCSAVVPLTWGIRADRISELESRLQFFEDTASWNVPNILAEMNEVNSKILKNISNIKEFEMAIENNKILNESIKNKDIKLSHLEKIIEKLNSDIYQHEKYIDSLFPTKDKFKLHINKSKSYEAMGIKIGLIGVGVSEITVNYENEKKVMHVGDEIVHNIDGKNCSITLSEFEYVGNENATFDLVCRRPTGVRLGRQP